jgi:hypothetical protein
MFILGMKRRSDQAKVSKVAISMPTRLYRAAERARRAKRLNRSEFFREAVNDSIRRSSQQLRGGPRSRGASGVQALLRLAGCLDAGDAEDMRRAIEEGCERVSASEW